MTSPELLAPAKDLSTALIAFHSGADAVYLGLKQFSARSKATNFSLDELRPLKGHALALNKKIYVAINTLIMDHEFPQLFDLLTELEEIKIDAVIVQDFGVLNFIKHSFPSLILHGSTQMAIHTLEGLKMANTLGLKRVVLPREMDRQEITLLQNEAKKLQIELEVFIHGALCYSFSGLCLFSGLHLNRSGNRGDCAQPCRSYYHLNGNKKYLFSCNDLFLGSSILELKKIGIASLKIEGRLKNSDYVSAVTSYYRKILDYDSKQQILSKDEESILIQNIESTFCRQKTKAFFYSSKGHELINPDYPKNHGTYIGLVDKVTMKGEEYHLNIRSKSPIDRHDQIIILKPGFNSQSIKLLIKKISNIHREGVTLIGIPLIHSSLKEVIASGDKVFCLKKSNTPQTITPDPKKYSPYKLKLPLNIKIIDSETLSLSVNDYYAEVPVTVTESTSLSNFETHLNKIFSESKEHPFTLEISSFKNNTPIKNPFIPPSIIKKIKNDFYQQINLQKKRKTFPNSLLIEKWNTPIDSNIKEFVALRSNLNPKKDPYHPFMTNNDFLEYKNASIYENYIFIPLFPIIPPDQEKKYFESLFNFLTQLPTDLTPVIGFNNIGHFGMVNPIIQNFPKTLFFTDIYIYLANIYSSKWVIEALKERFFFGYEWIESDNDLNLPSTIKIKEGKTLLPLFISRGCTTRHVFNKGQENPCSHCNLQKKYTTHDSNHIYQIITDNCINFLFQEKKRCSNNHKVK